MSTEEEQKKKDTARLKAFLAAGGNPNGDNPDEYTPLMSAAENENIESARILLEAGADINKKGPHGYTPLHIAVDVAIDGTTQTGRNNNKIPTDVIEFFIQHGADILAKNDMGETSIDIAKAYQCHEVVVFLEEKLKAQ